MDAIHLLVKMSTTVANAHALEGFPLFFSIIVYQEHCDF